MRRKPRRSVPKVLWRLFGNRARNLKDFIVDLITERNIQPEQCRCRGKGCLGCSSDKLSFLLRLDDPIHYSKLLHRCIVVIDEQTPPLLGFSPRSWWSQREIVEGIIEIMRPGSDCQNVICDGYDKYDQWSLILELLTSSSWEFLLNRVGHDVMVYLLQHTSIFLPSQGKKHQQVSGPPLSIKQKETLQVHENKRKQPLKKRHRLSSAAVASTVTDREKKPSKRSRLYLKRRTRQRLHIKFRLSSRF